MSKERIPGERDETTAAPTAPGIVGTTGYGVDLPGDLTADPTLNESDHQQSRWEGGGRTPHATSESETRSEEEHRGSPDTTVRREA